MARYDYYCKKCNEVKEIEKPIKDFDRAERCGGCNTELKREPPRDTSFVLKGTGWYKTDYPQK